MTEPINRTHNPDPQTLDDLLCNAYVFRRMRKAAEETLLLRKEGKDAEALAYAVGLCRELLGTFNDAVKSDRLPRERWEMNDMLVGDSIEVALTDIANAKQAITRLQKNHGSVFTVTKRPYGYYNIKRIG